jgi:hypothetical protein
LGLGGAVVEERSLVGAQKRRASVGMTTETEARAKPSPPLTSS